MEQKKSEIILGILLLFFGCIAFFVPDFLEQQFHVSVQSFKQSAFYGTYLSVLLLSKTIAALASLPFFYLGLKKIVRVIWG